MSFSAINTWSPGDPITAAQMNAISGDLVNALDKTGAAGGDTITGGVTVGSGGSLTIAAASATGLVVAASGKLSLSGTQTVNSGGLITVASGGAITLATGASMSLNGNGVTISTGVGVTTAGFVATNGPTEFKFGSGIGDTLTIAGSDALMGVSAAVSFPSGFANITVSASPIANAPSFNPQGFFQTNVIYTTNSSSSYFYIIPLRKLRNGAVLSSATMQFTPVGGHAGLPAGFPGFGIHRVKFDRTVQQALLSGNGYVQYSTGSLATYNAGNALSVTYTANQNNTIDSENYSYFAVINDECGANALAGNTFCAVQLTFTNVPDMRFG